MNDISIADIYELCAKQGKEFSLVFAKPLDTVIFEWRWIDNGEVYEYRRMELMSQLNKLIDIKGVISDFSNENNWVNYGVNND